MSIIISALHFPWQTIDDCLRTASSELGLDGVELSLASSFAHPHCTRDDLARLPEISAGAILDAHIWEDLAQLGETAGVAALQDWLECCRTAGITGIVIHGGSYPDRREGIRRTGRILRAVLDDFAAAGVTLKLENHYAYDYHNCQELFSEPWEFLELFGMVESPALRCCFDTGHGHMTRNWEALLRDLAPWLVHVHLADNGGIDDDHRPFRRGTVPWDGMFAVLRDIRYQGAYCVEFPVRDDREPFWACLGELRQLMA